jgi:hypothetical protein
MKPPSVVINDDGAEVQFDGIGQWSINWSQVQEIRIEVIVVPEVAYSEAFWNLAGPGVEFVAPVEIIVGANEFNARVFAFPRFDHAAFQHAREAEEKAEAGMFRCWRK